MFVDEARVLVFSGKGGDGAVSFHKEKYRPKGGPDGGNGGNGGSVIFEASSSVGSLVFLKDHPHQRAKPGIKGQKNNRQGADAEDLVIPVPLGTVIKDPSGTILADLPAEGQRYIAARGGRGGRGNASFLSDNRRAPGFGELGEPGQELTLYLELRLIGDVSVVGFPNVGKSTLVSVLSAAKPKIAGYPFTTLEPTLGMVVVGEERFAICDIPGLIEGAADGKGLGLKFLKHAERAALFLHVVDATSEISPSDSLDLVRAELIKYKAELVSRKEVVAINKIDLIDSGTAEELKVQVAQQGVPVYLISAEQRVGLDELKDALMAMVREVRAAQDEPQGFELFRDVGPDRFELSREDSAWRISGGNPERWVSMTDMSNPEAVGYLQVRLEKAGVEKALSDAGANHGDEVRIGDVSFEWWPAGTSPPDEPPRRGRK